MHPKPCKKWDFNYLHLNWWVGADFWLPSTVGGKVCVYPARDEAPELAKPFTGRRSVRTTALLPIAGKGGQGGWPISTGLAHITCISKLQFRTKSQTKHFKGILQVPEFVTSPPYHQLGIEIGVFAGVFSSHETRLICFNALAPLLWVTFLYCKIVSSKLEFKENSLQYTLED